MTPELQAEYDEAAKPFYEGHGGGGAITVEQSRMKSWRYFLEISSACNLHCPTCTKGSLEGYEHLNGIMPMDLMEKILDKIQSENPQATILTYGNSEPFIHPKLPECIASIKRRGLRCEVSSNLNWIRRVPEVLDARPDLLLISLSGWTQEVYVKGHAGGDMEKVKANMRIVAEENNSRPPQNRVRLMVNYHIYKDNAHEIGEMRQYAQNLGIDFSTCFARAISMENAIQYCRSKDPEATDFEVQEGRPDWNYAFPPVGKTYRETMQRLITPPNKAREMYAKYPKYEVCPVSAGKMFTFIRHDGKTQLCACTADRRITLGDFLETPAEDLSEQARGHSICKQCTKYGLRYYFHLVDPEVFHEQSTEKEEDRQPVGQTECADCPDGVGSTLDVGVP